MKKVGIVYTNHKTMDAQITYVRQFGTPVILLDMWDPTIDLLFVHTNSNCESKSMEGASQLRMSHAMALYDQARKSGISTFFSSNGPAFYLRSLYGSKTIVDQVGHAKTSHGTIALDPFDGLKMESKPAFFSCMSNHKQTYHGSLDANHTIVSYASAGMNLQKFNTIPVSKLLSKVGTIESFVCKAKMVGCSWSDPINMHNEFNGYYHRTYGYLIGDPVSNALINYLLYDDGAGIPV